MRATALKSVLSACIAARKPVLIKGAPGVGKSDIVSNAAREAGAELIIFHPVVSDPTDFKGLPGIVNDKAEFLPYGELRKLLDATTPTIGFFDDLGQAPMSVQAAAMQLLLAREINGHKISDFVTFVAATNRREDKAGVSGLLEPVKSRFATIVQLDVDVDDWINWALNENLPVEVIGYIKNRPEMLHKFAASADLVNSPSPRTVANLASLFEMKLPQEVELEVYTGAVGEPFAAEFLGFVKVYRDMIPPDMILLDPDNVAIPTNKPAVMYALCLALARKATENNFDRILRFSNRLPAEFNVLLVRDAIRVNAAVTTTKAFMEWASKNSDVML